MHLHTCTNRASIHSAVAYSITVCVFAGLLRIDAGPFQVEALPSVRLHSSVLGWTHIASSTAYKNKRIQETLSAAQLYSHIYQYTWERHSSVFICYCVEFVAVASGWAGGGRIDLLQSTLTKKLPCFSLSRLMRRRSKSNFKSVFIRLWMYSGSSSRARHSDHIVIIILLSFFVCDRVSVRPLLDLNSIKETRRVVVYFFYIGAITLGRGSANAIS